MVLAPKSQAVNSCGLTDSLAGLAVEAEPCPNCGGGARLTGGLCLGCLMQRDGAGGRFGGRGDTG